MNTPRDPTLLTTWVRRIDQLARRPSCAALRAELYEALDAKWDGVVVHAARALCRWGDAASIARVRATLARLAEKPGRECVVGPIADALLPHLCEDDLDWIIELKFFRAHRGNRWCLRDLPAMLPPDVAMPRIKSLANDPRIDRAQLAWTLRTLRASEHHARAVLDEVRFVR